MFSVRHSAQSPAPSKKGKGADYNAFAALFAKYRRRLAALPRDKAGPEPLTEALDDRLQETLLPASTSEPQRFILPHAADPDAWDKDEERCIASVSGYNSDMAKSRDKGNKEVKKPKKKK
jgi:hypothetical protein